MREAPPRLLKRHRRSARVGAEGPPKPAGWDLLVNCTPVGMHPNVDAMPVPASSLTGRYVYDLVYNPPAHAAAARGGDGGLRDDRRPRHAGRAGRTSSSTGGPE